MRQEFPAIFCQKRDKNEPKKEKKRAQGAKKRGKSQDIFLFFKGKQSPHKVFCQTRARFPRLDFGARTHARTHKNSLCASNSFERKGTRRDVVFFSRAFWSHLSLDQARCARRDFSSRHCLFLSFSRKKKLEEHQTHHRFGTYFARKERGNAAQNETRRKPTRIAASFARDERNVARFFSSFLLPRFFSSLLIARESWRASWAKGFFVGKKRERFSLGREGGGVRVTSQKKKKKKEAKKTDCLGYQTDTKFFSRFFF